MAGELQEGLKPGQIIGHNCDKVGKTFCRACQFNEESFLSKKDEDTVNRPSHYTNHPLRSRVCSDY